MKLKNILMCIAAVSVLFSCSDDKEPILDKPVELDPATMSICIDADGTIVSKAGTDQTISNMYVLIFKTNGDFSRMDKLDTSEEGDKVTEGTTGENGTPSTAENVDIEVEGGAHLVLVLANVKDESLIDGKKLSDVQKATTILSEEVDGNLTMSSEVMNVTFHLGKKNKIGYGNPGASDDWVNAYPSLNGAVKLYRSVARIQLSQLTLSNTSADPNYGVPVSFQLNDIFVANVKGYSHLASEINEENADRYLSIEATEASTNFTDYPAANGKLWWYGDWSEVTKEDEELGIKDDILKNILLDAAQTYEDADLLFCDANATPVLTAGGKYPEEVDMEAPIGDKSFYVYENEIYKGDEKGVGYQTLLVLKGDYTYKRNEPLNEKDELVNGNYVAKNRYYAIPVNAIGTITPKGILRTHSGIIRNTAYSLIININGPGSELPYQPDARLYYNAQVIAADWDEVVDITNNDLN